MKHIEYWKNVENDDQQLKYHLDQWRNVKQSTKFFSEVLRKELSESKSILDLGGGCGSATAYLARRYPDVQFVVGDFVPQLLELGRRQAKRENLANLSFEYVDWFDIQTNGGFDGVISLQTLSWLPEFERPMQEIFEKINSNWIGISSLFFPGQISSIAKIVEHIDNSTRFYNTYSMPQFCDFCYPFGYDVTNWHKFIPPEPLPKPSDQDIMGTYTLEARAKGEPEILQISGPLLLNWYVVKIVNARIKSQ